MAKWHYVSWEKTMKGAIARKKYLKTQCKFVTIKKGRPVMKGAHRKMGYNLYVSQCKHPDTRPY